MLPNNWRYLRGDIYYADMEPHIGSEQGGKRPVVVLQNNVGNRHSPTLIVATVTTRTEKKKNQPTHVLDTAFGVNETPSWNDFLAFLADRYILKTRKGLNHYLDAVGVPEYDPVLLVEKTQGRMAEDHKIARRLSVLKFGNKRVFHDFRDAFSADLSLRYLQHTGTIAGFGLIAVDDKILIYLRAVIAEGVFCTV